jgi:hypothetical protein
MGREVRHPTPPTENVEDKRGRRMIFYFGEDDLDPEEYGNMVDECRIMEIDRSSAIGAAIKDNPCHHFNHLGDFIVGRHITIVEVIDEVGGTHLFPLSSQGLQSWEAEGLLRAALR